jgi:excisionase family DNA binding protein
MRKTGNRVPGTGWTRPNDEVRPNQHASPGRRLISLVDAAEILGLSVASVRRLVSSGRLHIVKLNRRVLVDVKDLERLIDQAKDRGFWQ